MFFYFFIYIHTYIYRIKKKVMMVWRFTWFQETALVIETAVHIYMPCFFCHSRSSFHRVLTPSIMTCTSCTSEYPRRCLLEMS